MAVQYEVIISWLYKNLQRNDLPASMADVAEQELLLKFERHTSCFLIFSFIHNFYIIIYVLLEIYESFQFVKWKYCCCSSPNRTSLRLQIPCESVMIIKVGGIVRWSGESFVQMHPSPILLWIWSPRRTGRRRTHKGTTSYGEGAMGTSSWTEPTLVHQIRVNDFRKSDDWRLLDNKTS